MTALICSGKWIVLLDDVEGRCCREEIVDHVCVDFFGGQAVVWGKLLKYTLGEDSQDAKDLVAGVGGEFSPARTWSVEKD